MSRGWEKKRPENQRDQNPKEGGEIQTYKWEGGRKKERKDGPVIELIWRGGSQAVTGSFPGWLLFTLTSLGLSQKAHSSSKVDRDPQNQETQGAWSSVRKSSPNLNTPPAPVPTG